MSFNGVTRPHHFLKDDTAFDHVTTGYNQCRTEPQMLKRQELGDRSLLFRRRLLREWGRLRFRRKGRHRALCPVCDVALKGQVRSDPADRAPHSAKQMQAFLILTSEMNTNMW